MNNFLLLFFPIFLSLLISSIVSAAGPDILTVKGTYLNDHTHIADFNHDGLEDILLVSSERRTATVKLQQPDGSYQTSLSTYFQHDHADLYLENVLVGDFDRDGKLDFVIGYEQRYVSFYQGSGTGSFFKKSELEIPFDLDLKYCTGDINGDGEVDLVISTTMVSDKLELPLFTFSVANPGSDEFPLKLKFQQLKLAPIFKGRGAIYEIDELAIAKRPGATRLVMLDIGKSQVLVANKEFSGKWFQAEKRVASSFKPYGVEVFDLNQDGSDDLMLTPMFPRKKWVSSIWLADDQADGGFKSHQELITGVMLVGSAVGHFTRMDQPQLAISSEFEKTIRIYDIGADFIVGKRPVAKWKVPGRPALLEIMSTADNGLDQLLTIDTEKSLVYIFQQ